MTQAEVLRHARDAARRIWGVEPAFRIRRYRPWLFAGPVRWEAHAVDQDLYLVIDDLTCETLAAARSTSGKPRPRSPGDVRRDLLYTGVGCVVVLLAVALFQAAPPWLRGTLLLDAALAAIVGVRARLMARRDTTTRSTPRA